jgi:hypothetical protein
MWRGDQIFISYRGTQHLAADRIGDHLKARGFLVWRDAERLKYEIGAPWPDELNRQLNVSKALIVCLSPEYFESDWCKHELQVALDQKKRIYPIWIADRPPGYKTSIDDLQHLSLVGKETDFDAVMKLLIANLRKDGLWRRLEYYALWAVAVVALIGLAAFVAWQLWGGDGKPVLEFPRYADLLQTDGTEGHAVFQVATDGENLLYIMDDPEGGSNLFKVAVADALNKEMGERIFHIPHDQQILDLSVDCNGTAWIAVKDVGVYAVSSSGAVSFVLNKEDFAAWNEDLNSVLALASRCVNIQVEVYFGREAVHTLQYTDNNLEAYELLAPEDDNVYRQSADLPGPISALLLVVDERNRDRDRLWVMPTQGDQVVSFRVADTVSQQVYQFEQVESFESIAAGPDGAVWIGSQTHLFRITDEQMSSAAVEVEISPEAALPPDIVARALALEGQWAWIGSWCQDAQGQRRPDCAPLAVYRDGRFEDMQDGGTLVTVNKLWVSGATVWIATDNGLLFKTSEK